MSESAISAAAEALLAASRTGRPTEPLVTRWPGLDVRDAYQVQQRVVAARLAAGATLVGHKIGLTSAAMQEMLGIDQPDYGQLLSDMRVPDGGVVPAARFLAPRAEIEIAFVLRERLRGPGITRDDVLAATATVHAAIENIDSRVLDWRIGFVDTVADNASSGAFVISEDGVDPTGLDLASIDGTLDHNGQMVAEGSGAAVLGHPALAVAWLANALADWDTALEPGHVVLSGACTKAVPVVAGDVVRGRFGVLGPVSVTFG